MEAKKIFITGATGNIGKSLIKYLLEQEGTDQIIAGVRNVERAKGQFPAHERLTFRVFDFEDQTTFNALKEVDRVFLLRPPHLADVDRYFKPLIDAFQQNQINQVAFLSVQGVEKSKVIPHHKIEKLIVESGMEYIFVRPSYFMQNLTTTLYEELKTHGTITLPAGNAVFNWVDIENIGEASAILLSNFEQYKNRPFEITGGENLSFSEVVSMINQEIETQLKYRSVNPFKFFLLKKRQGTAVPFIMVMIMLHFLPRFQSAPKCSDAYTLLSKKLPTTIREFAKREQQLLRP